MQNDADTAALYSAEDESLYYCHSTGIADWRIARAWRDEQLPMLTMIGDQLLCHRDATESYKAALGKLFPEKRGRHTGGDEMGEEFAFPDDIIIPPGRLRDRLDEEAVGRLVKDIRYNGLRSPIVVRKVAGEDGTDLVLVAGRHRLEACRRLGISIWPTIFHGDETDARIFEISENLARAELTEAEKRQHIAEWVRLTDEKVRHGAAPLPGGVQPAEQGMRKAAKALGIDERSVRRAVAAESLSPAVKAAADKAGLGTVKRAKLASLTPDAALAEVVKATEAKQARRKQPPIHTPFQAEDASEGPDPPDERCRRSFANFAGDAVSMAAFWDKTFGPEWRKFKWSSDLVTLARQASDAWAEMAEHLSQNQE